MIVYFMIFGNDYSTKLEIFVNEKKRSFKWL